MTLGERLDEILDSLPANWSEALVLVTVATRRRRIGPRSSSLRCTPGRSGKAFRVTVDRGGIGRAPPRRCRASARTPRRGGDRRAALAAWHGGLPGAPAARSRGGAQPRRGLGRDCRGASRPTGRTSGSRSRLVSSADMERAALLLGPANPFLHEGIRPAFRFRAARRFGYGASPRWPAARSSGSTRRTIAGLAARCCASSRRRARS